MTKKREFHAIPLNLKPVFILDQASPLSRVCLHFLDSVESFAPDWPIASDSGQSLINNEIVNFGATIPNFPQKIPFFLLSYLFYIFLLEETKLLVS